MLCSQALANIIEIFLNKYHVYLHFIFAHLHLPCFSAEAYSEPLQTSKMGCFWLTTLRFNGLGKNTPF